ncbi:MAG TPA: MEDS domain-containing protein [Chitinophagaceae bacterium]|nr:MEDS domain-containing protein [Chitinophagaceae bacterium]
MEKIACVEEWETSNIQVFWGEIAPCEHMVQVYENEKIFLNTLEGFTGTGFLANDTVVIIATSKHLDALNERLRSQGFDLDNLIATDHYIPIDAEDLLSIFLVDDRIDENIFNSFITDLVIRAKKRNGKVRAFGEMVAILWEKGYCGATVQLENLWNQLHDKAPFTLFCAYPKNGFTQSSKDSINIICKQHAKVIDGYARPSTDIYYKTA